MEKRRFIPAAVLIVFVLCYSIASAGEKAVYDRDYNLRYHIDDSGQIYDRDYNRKGRVEGNKVYDENYKLKYRIEGDKVYDRDWNLKYRRDGDRIYDRNYNLKGIQVGMTYLRTSLHPLRVLGKSVFLSSWGRPLGLPICIFLARPLLSGYNLTSKISWRGDGMAEVATTKMSSRGQVVIPESIRKQLNLKAGSQFVVIGKDDVLILKTIAEPDLDTFEALITQARREAKESGLRPSDIKKTILRARKRS